MHITDSPMPADRFMESTTSYGLALLGLLLTYVEEAQALTILASLAILLIRLAYDGIRLWRYINRK